MKKQICNSTAEFLIFTSQAGENSIEVRVEDELDENSVCRDFRHTGSDGKSYNTKFYNFDAINSIGYRVNSKRATQFKQWATSILSEFEKYQVMQNYESFKG